MPELIEVELYRQTAESALGRKIVAIDASDGWYLKQTDSALLNEALLNEALVGRRFESTHRIGKLLLLGLSNSDDVLGLRFGMTGRLVVDGSAAIDELLYSAHRDEPAYVRFSLTFDDGGSLHMSDPRRLGGVQLNPDVTSLGPDAASISREDLAVALTGSGALKAALLNQARIAGVGNLIADEVLWQANLSPQRTASSLKAADLDGLHRALLQGIAELTRRGGSHLGDLMPARVRGGTCPRCGTVLLRETVGGRTSYWCPKEQL